MTDCGANHVPPIPELWYQGAQQRHVGSDGRRPPHIISVVVKVMARLYYGTSGSHVCVDSALDHHHHHHPCRVPSSCSDSASTFNYSSSSSSTTTTTTMNPRMYQELFDLRSLVVTLILKSPARNARALTVVMMQALLLVNRIVTQCESHSIQGLPPSLKSPRALFLACLTVAEACLMDTQTSTRAWSKVVASLTAGEIARLKNGVLSHLDYRVHVSGDEFDWWCKVVAEWMPLV
ncbi:hypothetical protein CcCBS67573_g08526 [Chytriomyces confervae]|uniref:Uncharacterized protein n=1 Tax=Chytriomyces confervae TaxID=246404 RepID=A0A507EJF5_9FUNG|nr:hypothetical protein CcCBS67573_g08526 [Chytriomyces confervae]